MDRNSLWLAVVGIATVAPVAVAQKVDPWKNTGVMLRADDVRAGKLVGGVLVRGLQPLDANDAHTVLRADGPYLELSGGFGWVARADVVQKGDPAFAFYTRKIQEEPTAGKWYGRRANAIVGDVGCTIPAPGQLKVTVGRPPNIVGDLTEAVRFSPNEVRWRLDLGAAYLLTGALDKAQEQYAAAIRLAPKNWRGHNGCAVVWFARHEFEKTIRDVDRAIELEPGEANLYSIRAGAWVMLGRYVDGLRDVDRAIELRPTDEEFLLSRATTRLELGDQRSGLADLDRLLELNPVHQEARLRKAVARAKAQEYGEALADCRQVQGLYPTAPDAYWREAHILATALDEKVRDGKRALELARVALLLAGADASYRVYNTLASAHAEVGEFDAAVAAQTKALTMLKANDPDNEKFLLDAELRLSCYKRKAPFRD